MQIKRKIPAFVFGVSIGLIIGVGFFIFKMDDYFSKMKSASSKEIKVIELNANEHFDGLSGWSNSKIPVIVINKNYSIERTP